MSKVRTLLAVVSLLVLSGVSIFYGSASPSPKAHSLDAIRLQGLFTANDPLAPRYLLLNDAILEYSRFKGQYATPDQLAQNGYLPFLLSSAYARRPMRNTCNGFSAGDYCFALNSPYDIAAFKVFDSSGSPVSNVFLEATNIGPADRDRPRTLVYQALSGSGLTEADQQLVFTGQLLGNRLLQVISAGSSITSAPSEAFSVEPYNQFKDLVSGDLLAFGGNGYGGRISFDRVRGGNRIRMTITGSSGATVYEADFGNLSEVGDTGAFRILRAPLLPGMTPTEDLPAAFPWQDGGAAACGTRTASAAINEPPALRLADSFRSLFSSRPAFAITKCLTCVTIDCCMPEGEPSCELCGKTQCCTVTVAAGCGCSAGQCCLHFECGIYSYNKCYGGG